MRETRMRKRFTLLFLAVFLTTTLADSADTKYFPDGSEHWYPQHLEAMKEPSLYDRRENQNIEVYRLLWLRTFHKPIAIRISKDSFGVKLRVVRLSGAGGYKPGTIEHDKTYALANQQWDHFTQLLAKTSFWKMPTADEMIGGKDGARWVLEGQAAGKYQVVDRWTPSVESESRKLNDFIACCQYLIELSNLEIPKKENY